MLLKEKDLEKMNRLISKEYGYSRLKVDVIGEVLFYLKLSSV
jgi:hypothetical protein